jgi:N-acyl-phosphatidylethanolamine-hydrolysing phospholipase D
MSSSWTGGTATASRRRGVKPKSSWFRHSTGPRAARATRWPPCGAVLPCSDCHLLFAGDTGYSRDFGDIRRHFESRQTPERGGGFDIALLPIGAYEPRWFMSVQHVNVEEALQIHDDLGAKRSLGVHWGTFELTDESLDEPPRKLAELRVARGMAEDSFFVLAIGETTKLAARAVAMKEI